MDELLKDIESRLFELIPAQLRQRKLERVAYALFLCYIDTTTNDHIPYPIVAFDDARKWMLEHHSADASHNLWQPQREMKRGTDFVEVPLADSSLRDRIESCYDAMDSDANDEIALLPFRKTMWRLANRLNAIDWKGVLAITDDFVVVATDWSGFWVEEDAKKSIPEPKKRLLESRRLFFGTGDRQSAAKTIEDYEQKLAGRPPEEQVGFWIREVQLLAEGKTGILKQNNWTALEGLTCLFPFGSAAVEPLLDLAVAIDAMPHEIKGRTAPSVEVLSRVFHILGVIEHADGAVEKRLRKMLDDSCRANEHRERWTETPFLCASLLWRLFNSYDFPSKDDGNVLCDWKEWLAAPYNHGS
jgi:hypothetical protein